MREFWLSFYIFNHNGRLKIFVPLMIMGLTILVPINITGQRITSSKAVASLDIDKLSLRNVPDASKRYKWLHLKRLWYIHMKGLNTRAPMLFGYLPEYYQNISLWLKNFTHTQGYSCTILKFRGVMVDSWYIRGILLLFLYKSPNLSKSCLECCQFPSNESWSQIWVCKVYFVFKKKSKVFQWLPKGNPKKFA